MKNLLRKTLLGLTLLVVGTSVSYAQNNMNASARYTELNNWGKPQCITVSKANKENKNKNIKQYKLTYTDRGNLYSKEVLKWDTTDEKWNKCVRYIYEYNSSGKFAYQIVQKWDKKNATWNNEGYMIYDAENGFIAATK